VFNLYLLTASVKLSLGKFIKRRSKEMGTIIAKAVVTRKPGFLYYIDSKGNVCEAKMARGGKKKSAKKKAATKKTAKKK
jgi:hypothetical protein